MLHNGGMSAAELGEHFDSPALRKSRGAFFTPSSITDFVVDWGIRSDSDRVLEPSAGEAAFLVSAVARLQQLGVAVPDVHGVEIHSSSAETASALVAAAGGSSNITVADFFSVDPRPNYDVVIGNPPFIRYQDFSGESRAHSRAAALRAGVSLTALASSWAAFAVHSALFLRPGGRLGLVLPAELLSVNSASAGRRFVLEKFSSVHLVLFEEQVFPDAEADVVLLLADGYAEGPTSHAIVSQARNGSSLREMNRPTRWTPPDPAGKWTGLLVGPDAVEPLNSLLETGQFSHLEDWGDTTLGMVTGNNNYFALSAQRVAEHELLPEDVVRLSPPGSSHLRGLSLTHQDLETLEEAGRSTWLFYPQPKLSDSAARYIEAGHAAGVDQAYKCRVRKPWYRVPLVKPSDLLLTCMNSDTPRLTTNRAGVRHLNSVHGVYLQPQLRQIGRSLLPLASLNSITLLNAEMVGRSYGGGVLKIEPREADVWAMPSTRLVLANQDALRSVRSRVARLLKQGRLLDAVEQVDSVLLEPVTGVDELTAVRQARAELAGRRMTRGRSGG